jgi:intracellular septation protein A
MQVVLALLPVLVFWLLETEYGTRVATSAAVVTAIADVAWTRWRDGRWARLPMITAGLVVVMGGMSLASDDPRFVRATPVIGDLVMGALLAVAVLRGGNPLIAAVAEAEPDVAITDEERGWLNRVAWRVVANFGLHAALCAWAADQPTSVWAFVSGPLQLGMLGAQVAGEAIAVRLRAPPSA